MSGAPRYLKEYSGLWDKNPRAANLKWFENAGWGLFLHYGLYSQLGRHEWVQFREKIPVAEYEKLAESFSPQRFDADFITDLALEAEMKYVNLTACHHEGFCLWNSSVEAFNSYSFAKRNLVEELAEACDRKGLGFFAYFTNALNWRHPYSISREYFSMGRPHYDEPDPTYKGSTPHDFEKFWEWSHGCIEELCGIDKPLAGIWLDLISCYYMCPELVPIEKTYSIIREKRPEALVCFKQGATGEEDYAAPEFHFRSSGEGCRKMGSEKAALLADRIWEINRHKHNEICMTLQEDGWGYVEDTPHRSCEFILGNLAYAQKHNCNLLVNTGPLPDGSIHEEDIRTLREAGEFIRKNGLPTEEMILTPENHEDVTAQ